MTDKQIIIDASKCEWRTGVEHCGNYECMLNKCCDYNCDWYKRRKFEQQLKRKERECEELKKELQAQRNFTAQEQRKIYCVAYDKTCETGNECKQKKCVFKDRLKYKQTLTEIKPILEFYANSNMGEEQPDKTYHIMVNGSYIMVYDPKPARQALQKISEAEND